MANLNGSSRKSKKHFKDINLTSTNYMCGITGIYYKDGHRNIDPSILTTMRDAMVYRGPDDSGNFIQDNVGLAHRRLSIVGLSTGHQPMSNSEKSLWIVFNGEIYNYRELKNNLQKKGYVFQTESDTEVIINLYAEYGKECVNHMNGMFAFAIWDSRKKCLFLARDRLGVKPLYYSELDGAIIFGSEIKSILKYPASQASCNEESLYEYFLFRSVAGENTLFSKIRSLLPGHHMTVTSDQIKIDKYWDPRQQSIDTGISFEDACMRFDELLSDAVKIRLMSEVPLGTFCSGGVDSSLVTAIASKIKGEPVNTFSVGFDEKDYDESYYANIVSKQYGTIHHELTLNNAEFTNLLPNLIHLNDEPLNFSNSVHIYAISKLAKEYVTVVLTGEGADELFLGYPRFLIPKIANSVKYISGIAGPLFKLMSSLNNDHRLDKLSYYFNSKIDEVIKLNSATNRKEAVENILKNNISRTLPYRNLILEQDADMKDILARLSLQDQHTYLVSLLNRQDKMSMGASIESRVPFLDYRIAEFANSLPAKIRMKGFNSKMLVKKVAENYLPDEVIYRRKSGFGVPLSNWLRQKDGLGGLAKEIIYSSEKDSYLDNKALRVIYQQHTDGVKDHCEILWTAVNFLLWKQSYGI